MSNQFLRLVVRPEPDVARLIEGIREFVQPRWEAEPAQVRPLVVRRIS
jgi:hypothetical protein